jgi:hypothetical protein
MKNIFVFGLLLSVLHPEMVIAQMTTVMPTPIPSSLLPDDPFTTVTTRFSCAEGQSLVITAKVPPKTLSVEFDDKRGIVAYRSEGSAGAAYDPLAAGIASERITAREARFWAKVEADRRAENRDRLTKAESRNAPVRKLTKDELSSQRDAYEEMLDNLERTQPIIVKHKYRSYSLMLERTYTGPKYVSRSQGVEWSVRNRLGMLRSTFSGRLIATNCRQGSALEKAADMPAVISTQ